MNLFDMNHGGVDYPCLIFSCIYKCIQTAILFFSAKSADNSLCMDNNIEGNDRALVKSS